MPQHFIISKVWFYTDAKKITMYSNVILGTPIGKICSELLCNMVETVEGRNAILSEMLKAYIHDFLHCVYIPGNDDEFQVGSWVFFVQSYVALV